MLVVKVSERTAAVEACILCQRRVNKGVFICTVENGEGVTGVTG